MDAETTANQYLTFTLDGDQYAADVARVREVLEVLPVTRLPQMPEYMLGVINIRGGVVPVVDLRKKFGMNLAEQTVDTSIVVMDVDTGTSRVTIGCLADSVEEVIDIAPDDVEDPPSFGTSVNTAFISGIARKDESFIILLNIDRVFAYEELVQLDERAATTES